ncbi:MAG: hypothetical protein GXP63_06430 [DPANN group archaeon]|nr:hypothetical protein [DPANN group archaeon]
MGQTHWGWIAWFLIIASWTYSPMVAPAGVFSPFILGLPFTLFWWMVLTLILLVSVILFANRAFGDGR